jgi:hypothetical protein
MQIVKNFNKNPQATPKLMILLAEEHPLTAKIEKKGLESILR